MNGSSSGQYNTVQPNFNPEVGFIRRRESTQYLGEFSWLPRMRRGAIRNLIFGATTEYVGGATGDLETRTQGVTTGIQLADGGSVNFNIDRTFDRLVEEDFEIRPGVLIPVGDYRYLSYSGQFSTNQSRKVSANGNVTLGEFWNGDRRSLGGGVTMRPSYHLNVDARATAAMTSTFQAGRSRLTWWERGCFTRSRRGRS